MKTFTRWILLIAFLWSGNLLAQVPNDNCNGAIILNDLDGCSLEGQYTNVGATQSTIPFPSCFTGSVSNDVWFVFTARRTRLSIRVVGNTAFFTGGTMNNPVIALYSGTCGNLTEIACQQDNSNSRIASIAATLNVGESYFLRVDSRGGNTGTFQLCFTSFDDIPSPISDCQPGVLLCDKSPVIAPFLSTAGNDPNEVGTAPCEVSMECNYSEDQSAWYKWICKDPGQLTFNLTPLNPVDDLDFWVYELPNGVDDCTDKIPLMCMASGAVQGTPISNWIRCHGPTGLRMGETDDHENCGCAPGDNNYIMPLQMEAGKAYALVVMNFSSSGSGFEMSFGGDATFVGPDINFEIDPELDNQCDIDSITFIDSSIAGIGSISSYTWNFGNGANPRIENSVGPHEVVYNSFGPKNIVLQISTTAGCTKTEIKQIFIEPCCDPANDLAIDVFDVTDPLCPDIPSGSFTVNGSGGNPAYLFSTDGVDFFPITQYNGLAPGIYEVFIQDIKGCEDSAMVDIQPPPTFAVEAGPDQTINLGEQTSLFGTIFGSPPYEFGWFEDPTLSCTDCIDPDVFPPFTTTYFLEANNEVGCRAIDSVTIFVEVIRPVYIPSAFSPNGDGINDFFTAYTGPQVRLIKRLLIFDRWGNLVFEATDIPPNSETLGWDGSFKGKFMDSNVFAYYIEIEFIDDVVLPYEGDITLVK
ncbi:MAG: gliding motility-associated C-terminal domain-containing protein [Saprospiraceae bacterium]